MVDMGIAALVFVHVLMVGVVLHVTLKSLPPPLSAPPSMNALTEEHANQESVIVSLVGLASFVCLIDTVQRTAVAMVTVCTEDANALQDTQALIVPP